MFIYKRALILGTFLLTALSNMDPAARAHRLRSSLEGLWSHVTGLSVRVVQGAARAAAAGYSSDAWSPADSAAGAQ